MSQPANRRLVVGADIGGTSTRVGIADLDGHILGVARGGPGNPNTVGPEASAARIRTTTEEALASVDGATGADVVAAALGLAGSTRITDPDGFCAAALPESVRVPGRLVTDLAVAFCSGTPARDGYVLIAGTGAGASRIVDDRRTERRGAWGYLLGDEGSGFWLGRAAVRATLEALERGEALGPLGRRVQQATGTSGMDDLISACYAHPPAWLADLAVLVSDTADQDATAAEIAQQGADVLASTLGSLAPEPGRPVVFAGSVLTGTGPISGAVEKAVAGLVDGPVLRAGSGLAGALWVAVRDLVNDAPDVHSALADSVRNWT